MKLSSENIEREILKREKSKGRDLNVTMVRTAMRHFWDILSEAGDKEIDLFVKNRVRYYRKKGE